MTKKLSADLEWDMGQGARDKEQWESEVSAEAKYDSDWRLANGFQFTSLFHSPTILPLVFKGLRPSCVQMGTKGHGSLTIRVLISFP